MDPETYVKRGSSAGRAGGEQTGARQENPLRRRDRSFASGRQTQSSNIVQKPVDVADWEPTLRSGRLLASTSGRVAPRKGLTVLSVLWSFSIIIHSKMNIP